MEKQIYCQLWPCKTEKKNKKTNFIRLILALCGDFIFL